VFTATAETILKFGRVAHVRKLYIGAAVSMA